MSASVEVREARAEDEAALRVFCSRLDPGDYAAAAWRDWLGKPGDLNLLAVAGGEVVGCVRAGRVSASETFSQAMRVAPAFRRRGVATLLMARHDDLLRNRGFAALRGVTGIANEPARRFYAAIGWAERGAIARRQLRRWRGELAGTGVDPGAVVAAARGSLVSIPGVALYRRIYFAAQDDWLTEACARHRVAAGGGAIALADGSGEGEGGWIHTLIGAPAATAALLAEIVRPGAAIERTLTVDAPDEPRVQQVLDGLGFDAAGAGDRYVLLERALDGR
jgi:GNAT superfamily N-acetyltransferase